MLYRRALGRLATQASKQPAIDAISLAHRFRQLALSSGYLRTPAYSRSFAEAGRPVGRPKKGGAVTAKASTRRAPSTATTKRAPAKKASTSTKAKAKKTVPKKKAKPAPKKKVLTEAQKLRADEKKHTAEIKELKATALFHQEPKAKAQSAWTIYNAEHLPKGSVADVRTAFTTNAAAYRSLTPAEREHYNHLANEAKAANKEAYSSWVDSHTAEDIKKANAARRRLKQILTKDGKVKKGTTIFSPIKDERQVKRPTSSYSIFFTERQKSGDFEQIAIAERAKLASNEWKALSDSEKRKYTDLYEEDAQRYRRQFKSTYGYEVPLNGHATAAATATA